MGYTESDCMNGNGGLGFDRVRYIRMFKIDGNTAGVNDRSKCRKNGKPDGPCCAYKEKNEASCADGYTIQWPEGTYPCSYRRHYGNKYNLQFHYKCIRPVGPQKESKSC